jgi:hypothetical protein
MAYSAESQEKSSDSYVHSVEAGGNKENGAINIFASREFNTVFILISLAE